MIKKIPAHSIRDGDMLITGGGLPEEVTHWEYCRLSDEIKVWTGTTKYPLLIPEHNEVEVYVDEG